MLQAVLKNGGKLPSQAEVPPNHAREKRAMAF